MLPKNNVPNLEEFTIKEDKNQGSPSLDVEESKLTNTEVKTGASSKKPIGIIGKFSS